MVEDLSEGMEDEVEDSHEVLERLLMAYHTCVEAKAELEAMRVPGEEPHAEVLALSAIYDGLMERIGGIRVEPVVDEGV
jgi:hypothetical protein